MAELDQVKKDTSTVIQKIEQRIEGDKVAVGAVTNEIIPSERTYKVFLIKSGSSEIEILEEDFEFLNRETA